MIRSYAFFALILLLSGCQSLNISGASHEAQRLAALRLNHYDDDWQTPWVTHAKEVFAQTALACGVIPKTPGFIVHLGDSMTYASPYGRVSQFGVANFSETIGWSRGRGGIADSPDNKDGWQLARFDHPAGNRSYTAASGIGVAQYLRGGHGTFASGHCDLAPLRTLLSNQSVEPAISYDVSSDVFSDGSSEVPLKMSREVSGKKSCDVTTGAPLKKHDETVPQEDSAVKQSHPIKIAIIADSIAAVILLGSNDIAAGRRPEEIVSDLDQMVNMLLARHIVPILTTIPPRLNYENAVRDTNIGIRRLAQQRALPLIGFYEEILRRQPTPLWYGTLISEDGVHPTAGAYQDPSLHPEVLNASGYTLRGYLTLLKLHEFREQVIKPFHANRGTESRTACR